MPGRDHTGGGSATQQAGHVYNWSKPSHPAMDGCNYDPAVCLIHPDNHCVRG
ncbi:hypothetical protein DPMN_147862 [Dreissena polymorpha]|uniref:Uncharacterized protein n=1 Tax=Dreissena polymorpha TaxID=45954 RepID=A0A9D4IZP4_DREPO|nr:hypothetical protein DPMN_147862 [Dreissena polymorpha]